MGIDKFTYWEENIHYAFTQQGCFSSDTFSHNAQWERGDHDKEIL